MFPSKDQNQLLRRSLIAVSGLLLLVITATIFWSRTNRTESYIKQLQGAPDLFGYLRALVQRAGGSQSKSTRQAEAAVKLGELGTNALPAVPTLIAALASVDDNVTACASEALGKIGAPAQPYLIEALSAEQSRVRIGALHALWDIRTPKAVDAISRMLLDTNDAVRRASFLLLGDLGATATRVVPIVSQRLNSERPLDRYDAAVCLSKIGIVEKNVLLRISEELRVVDEGRRLQGLEVLGRVGDPAAAPGIEACLKDKSERTRIHAAQALWRVTKRSNLILPELLDIINDPESRLRFAAMDVLVEMGSVASDALPAPLKLSQDRDVNTRAKALSVIAAITR